MVVETYLPPFKRLAHRFSIAAQTAYVGEMIQLLLRATLVNGGFDAGWYEDVYPDVAEGLAHGTLPTSFDHFCAYGFFEERRPRLFAVDEPWYCRQYGDVKAGIAAGRISGAAEHYNLFGWAEGRAPSGALLPQVMRWNNLLLGNI